VATELGCDFGGAALQKIVAVNGLSIPTTVRSEDVTVHGLSFLVTATSLSAPSCSAVEGMTGDGAIGDNTDIPAARDGTAPPGRLRASTSGWNSAVKREPRFDFGGTAPQESVAAAGLSIQVITSNSNALNWLQRV